jgi:hypothetical protein
MGRYGTLLDAYSNLSSLQLPFKDSDERVRHDDFRLLAGHINSLKKLQTLCLHGADRLLPFLSLSSPVTTISGTFQCPNSRHILSMLSSVAPTLEVFTDWESRSGGTNSPSAAPPATPTALSALRRILLQDHWSPLLLPQTFTFPAVERLILNSWSGPLPSILDFVRSSTTLKKLECTRNILVVDVNDHETDLNATLESLDEQLKSLKQVCEEKGLELEIPRVEVVDRWAWLSSY